MKELPKTDSQGLKWSKRIGFVAFLFFLIKGLLWLLIPSLLAYLAFK